MNKEMIMMICLVVLLLISFVYSLVTNKQRNAYLQARKENLQSNEKIIAKLKSKKNKSNKG